MLEEKPFYLGVTFGFAFAIALLGICLAIGVVTSLTFYRALAIQLSGGSLVGPFYTAGIVAATGLIAAYCTIGIVIHVHDALAG